MTTEQKLLEAKTAEAVTEAKHLFASLEPNTKDFIQVARELLKPEPVKLSAFPMWLTKRSRAYLKKNGVETRWHSGSSLFNLVLQEVSKSLGLDYPTGMIDHDGTCIDGPYKCCQGQTCFVSEPYGFGLEWAQICDGAAKALDICWHVSANSFWNPPATIRLMFHERAALETALDE